MSEYGPHAALRIARTQTPYGKQFPIPNEQQVHDIEVNFDVTFTTHDVANFPNDFIPKALLHNEEDDIPVDWNETLELQTDIHLKKAQRKAVLKNNKMATRWAVKSLKARKPGRYDLIFLIYPADTTQGLIEIYDYNASAIEIVVQQPHPAVEVSRGTS
ncbi:uncharacterized protein B0I36DRAFT_334939 [Microdochium trichocladiopsis]|uniref:Uncharacterized protein n=1 Tax=Microdochium trichocladiopsis TaxID=1682393 RepID=A0A9P8XW31_9PEZI|nr:uncharacterized protein B0I36DRAFT_334939 [Microdochium trichocladiopsis]KAH7021631.1 hypothetical protein B0I36DRAFT_334939 [Microdochium trichocladiopsis]